jgi:anti-sigma B factor antagonist
MHDFTLIELDGSFTEHEEVAQLQAMVNEVAASGPPRVLLDIKALQYVNSTGLGGLVQLFTTVQGQHGGELWLCHPSKRVDDLLAITRLRTVFHIADADTLSRLLTGKSFVAACPVCSPREWIAMLPGRAEHDCGRCGARFALLADPLADDDVLADCIRVRVPTYDDEYVELVADERGTW